MTYKVQSMVLTLIDYYGKQADSQCLFFVSVKWVLTFRFLKAGRQFYMHHIYSYGSRKYVLYISGLCVSRSKNHFDMIVCSPNNFDPILQLMPHIIYDYGCFLFDYCELVRASKFKFQFVRPNGVQTTLTPNTKPPPSLTYCVTWFMYTIRMWRTFNV